MTTKKILVLLALALGACRAQNRSSIEILGRAASSSPTDCTYAPGGKFLMGPGTLDVGPAYNGFLRYEIPLYVNNLLEDPTTQAPAATASSKDWRPDVAKVRVNPSNWVKDNNPSPSLMQFPTPPENTVPLDGQVIPVNGKAVLLVNAVSQQLGQVIQMQAVPGELRRIVLGITLQGHTLDNQFLETGEWYYPVDVCVNCLPCLNGCTGTAPLCTAPAVAVSSCGGPGQDTETVCAAPGP